MPERNNSKIRNPLLVNTDLGTANRNVYLTNTTVKPDSTIWTNNPKSTNNAQRIAQSLLGVGSSMQDAAKLEVEEARMNYAERKQKEAEAKQAAREAKAEAKIAEAEARVQDIRNAKQLAFENHSKWRETISEASSNLLQTEGASQQSHNDGMVAMLPSMIEGLNQNQRDVIEPLLQGMITKEMDRGYSHFEKINTETAATGYLTALSNLDMPVENRLEAIKLTDEEALSRGLDQNKIVNIRNNSFLNYMTNLASEGREHDMQEVENLLRDNGYLDITDSNEAILQTEFNKLQEKAKGARATKETTAERNSFEATFAKISNVEDKSQLEAEMMDVTLEETDGSFLSLKEKSGKLSAYDQKLKEVRAFSSQFAPEVADVSKAIDEKLKQTQADGSIALGEAGVRADSQNITAFLMGSERRKLDTEVTNALTDWARKEDIRKGDPRVLRKVYELYGTLGEKWGLNDYNPEKTIIRELDQVDSYYYESNPELVNKQAYAKISNERKRPGDEYRLINNLIPLSDDPVKNKEIRRIHNSIYDHIKKEDRKTEMEQIRIKSMVEEEVFNQTEFYNNQLDVANNQISLGGGLGVTPPSDMALEIDYNSDENTIFRAISDIIGGLFTPPDDAFPYSDDVFAAASMVIKEETGNSDPFTGKTRDECIDMVKELQLEGKLKEVQLQAERNVTNYLNMHLKEEKDKTKELKGLFIKGEAPTKTSMRIEGYQ